MQCQYIIFIFKPFCHLMQCILWFVEQNGGPMFLFQWMHTYNAQQHASSKCKQWFTRHLASFISTRKYYPSSRQFRDPPTYTHQPSMQQKVPFSLIKCSSSKVAFCSCVEWGWHIYNIVESESDPLTFSKKNPSRAIPRSTYIHPPSLAKIDQRTSEEIGNKQTDKQTNAARFIVWFLICLGEIFTRNTMRDVGLLFCVVTLEPVMRINYMWMAFFVVHFLLK